MATIAYPQVIKELNPYIDVGQGLDMVGQVISRVRDRIALRGLPEVLQAAQQGDMSGMASLAAKLSPQGQQTMMQTLQLMPQNIFSTDSKGQLTKLGSLPFGSKFVPPDRTAEVTERMLSLEAMKEKARAEGDQKKYDHLSQIEADRMARAEMAQRATDERQARNFEFQDRMQTRREDLAIRLGEMRANKAGKDDYDKETRQWIKDYSLEKYRIRTDIRGRLKDTLKKSDREELLKEETERLKMLDDTYKPFIENMRGITSRKVGSKSGASADPPGTKYGTYNGRRVKQVPGRDPEYAD